jgi:hypothetical protein
MTEDTRVEDYLAATRSPEKPKRDTSGDIYENFPRHTGETNSDYHLRRILHQQAEWRALQSKNGTVEEETFPRLIHPDQYYM